MALQLGDPVPDFTQSSTEGDVRFHEYIDDKWAVLFSHPKDFTPVCTTELGQVSRLKPEFDKHMVATPVDWKQGDDVMILPSVSNEDAKSLFPDGWDEKKPYLRTTKQPGKTPVGV
jgi:alkyl hydroperoxide reductase subunit AhpC